MNYELENIVDNQNNYTIEELFFILRKHLKTSIALITSVFLLTLIYTFSVMPIYRSTGMVMIENLHTTQGIFGPGGLSSDNNYIENEIEILKSRTTSERTAKYLLENHNNLSIYNNHKFNWLKPFNDSSFNKIVYNSNNKDSIVNYVSNKIRKNLSITNQRKTDMIKISIDSFSPYEASLITNTLIDQYKKIDLEWATGEMSHLKDFLSSQISLKEKELSVSENNLRNFQETTNIFAIDDKSNLLLQNLINAESKLYNAKAENNIINQRIKYIRDKLTDDEKQLTEKVSNTISNRLFALKNEIASSESELVSAVSQQGDDHEIVKAIKNKIDKLKLKLENETRILISQGVSVADPLVYRQSLMDSVINITAYGAMLNNKVYEFEKLVSQYESELEKLPEDVLKFTRLSRNQNIDTETYSLMRQKLEETKINEASQIGKVRVVDPAKPWKQSVKPVKSTNLILGLILGIFISFSVVFLIEFFDNTVSSVDELERRGLTILALIPSIGSQQQNRNKRKKNYKYKKPTGNIEKLQRRMITHEDPKSPISEAYRSLRTSLLYSKNGNNKINENKCKIILVSSPGPGEGKTTTLVNLAITYANLGKRTLLIDGDLRKPVTHKVFNVEKEPGITSYLSGSNIDINTIIQPTEIENLDAITCGVVPPNPSEILASNSMGDLLNNLKEKYDYIMIDSPPLLAVTDTIVCMKYTDQFFLVVRAGKTEKGGLSRSLEQLKLSNAPLCGILMNAIDESNAYGRGYYYNYYQYYYGEK